MPTPLPGGRLAPGASITPRTLTPVTGPPLELPDPDPARLTHLQFRRFAGCPVCNLHLRSVVRRHTELTAAGVREVVLFHSPADELRTHVSELPFPVVADPDKRLYVEFGVESAPRALLNPRVWGPLLRAVLRSAWTIPRHREHAPAAQPHGGRLGLPADFLIDAEGRIIAARYGEHAYDQWSVDEVLARAGEAGALRSGSRGS
ncbi:peroxiredoxin-like family protein [Streptomyces murinus]|uniref:peroxiredoxin-like family protein n=1 Tax=Streptomyces murinus TaxID=33900 RepID=UPI0037B42F38